MRTVGLGGLGALGVSFGRVVAMDSPAARRVGEFNWGSTLWHELGHVFTLGATDGRVPRWLSEGLSVYEERRARPAWGEDPSPLFFATYAGGQLPKVSRLNDGFMRPAFPAQVPLSYYLASMVCEMIEQERGVQAIRAMLDGYRRGLSTEHVRQGLDGHVSLQDLRAFWRPISPWSYLDRVSSERRTLLVYARYDLTFPVDLSRTLVEEWRRRDPSAAIAVLPCGHYSTGRAPFKFLDGWHLGRFFATNL